VALSARQRKPLAVAWHSSTLTAGLKQVPLRLAEAWALSVARRMASSRVGALAQCQLDAIAPPAASDIASPITMTFAFMSHPPVFQEVRQESDETSAIFTGASRWTLSSVSFH